MGSTKPYITDIDMFLIPRINRFCCLDVKTGIKYFCIGLSILWIITALAAFFGGEDNSAGYSIWNVLLAVCNVVVYVLVILGIKNNNKMFIIPALIVSIFDIITTCITAVFWFITFSWITAFLNLILAAFIGYFFLGLHTVYADMGSGAAPAEPV